MDMERKSNRIFGNELKYLKEVLETDFRTSAFGMMADRFEKAFAEKIGVNYETQITRFSPGSFHDCLLFNNNWKNS